MVSCILSQRYLPESRPVTAGNPDIISALVAEDLQNEYKGKNIAVIAIFLKFPKPP